MQDKTYKIVQLTDSHLFASKSGAKFLGVDPYLHLKQVAQKIKTIDPSCIIMTGDISHDKSAQSYENFSDIICDLKIKTYWYPGNHDNYELMRSIFSNNVYLHNPKKFTIGNWLFIYVETNVSNKDYGHVSEKEIKFIEKHGGSTKNNVVLLMHHHPLFVKTPLIDQFVIDNGSAFLNVIKKYAQIKLIICGHAHGDYSIKFDNHLSIECGPATSIQWKKGAKTMETIRQPGYKIYNFHSNSFCARGELLC